MTIEPEKLIAVRSSETSGTICPAEQRHVPKDRESSTEFLVLYLACVLTILGLNSAKISLINLMAFDGH